MLDRLEHNSFVNRTRGKTDRRVVIIELTDAGEEKLKYVLAIRKKSCSTASPRWNPLN